MKIPKRLEKCSIVDSLCEIRFDPLMPPEIAVGMIAGILNSLFTSELEGLPVLQIPEPFRNMDEQFRFAPHYRVKIGDTVLQFSGTVIVVASPIPYVGWDSFKPEIEKIIHHLVNANIIKNVNRVARRTINFFPEDILENLNFEVKTTITLERPQYHYIDCYKIDNLMIRTTIGNQAVVNGVEGSIIDIDAYVENPSVELLSDMIEKTHFESKKVFFTLLKPSFIEMMIPVYE